MTEPESPAARSLRLRVVRTVFALFAVAVALGTHWPGVRIEGAVPRPDLVVHVAAFAAWAFLLMLCRFFGPVLSLRNVVISALIAVSYAALDEATQAVPMFRRVAVVDDFLAGAAGVLCAVGTAWLMGWARRAHGGVHGPQVWAVSLGAGLVLGGLVTTVLPVRYERAQGETVDQVHPLQGEEIEEAVIPGAEDGPTEAEPAHGPTPVIPLALCVPFAALLGSIAVMPFISERFWHHHFADFAFLLGGVTTGYYLLGFTEPYAHGLTYGVYQMTHVLQEYVAFIALVGGLYVASGGVVVEVRGRGRPMSNVVLLGVGAVLANVVGTTGASMLLIRPFMRLNAGRLRAIHIVMFIFIISNCGGALTPIGDPPLYLGYLKGIPFFWTLEHLWPMWLVCNGALLATFFVIDSLVERGRAVAATAEAAGRGYGVRVRGVGGMFALAVIIGAVFIDPLLAERVDTHGVPVGPIVQALVAAGAYAWAPRAHLAANEFTFFPVKEVGLLFVGIFATMAPALGYLAAHGASLGIDSPTKFYFATGALSGVLDNAPTYANFLQIAFGPEEMTVEALRRFAATAAGAELVRAVSLGAVFFGAMTYIGNGPNFMVKAIAERSGVRMPSFFGYMVRALLFLTPAIVLVWAIFIR